MNGKFLQALTLCGLELALVGGVSTASAQDAYDPANQPLVGTEAPAFELDQVGGERLALEDLRGEFVVIHFGTSW